MTRSTRSQWTFTGSPGELRVAFTFVDGPVRSVLAMIVDGAVYRDGRRVATTSEPGELVAALTEEGSFAWVGLRIPSAEELQEALTATCWTCDAAEVVGAHDRPVLTTEDEFVHLVLRTARYSEKEERVTLGELSVLFDDRTVVTVRHGQASELTMVRRRLERHPAELAAGVPAVIAAIVDQVVTDYGPALDGFEHDVIEVESDVFSESRYQPGRRLYSLKREVRQLLVAIDALTFPLHRMLRTVAAGFPDHIRADLAESIEQLERTILRTRSLSGLLDAAIDANLTQVSLQQNEDMRRISAWVAMAAGPTLVAGIYGMNFEHLPELHWRYGYQIVMVTMAVLVLALFRAFRRSGWL